MKLNHEVLLIVFATNVFVCYSEENATSVGASRERLEKQALKAYKNSCLVLREITNWLSVLFRIKSVWARSTIDYMAEKTKFKFGTGKSSFNLIIPKRRGIGSECSTLRNLNIILRNYIHLQAQLLQLKALLGASILQSSALKLDAARAILQERLKNLDALNRTSTRIFDTLKLSSQVLSSEANFETSRVLNLLREFQKGNGFFGYLQAQGSNVLRYFQDAVELNENAKASRSLLETGDFFQNLGKVLDSYLLPGQSKKAIKPVENASSVPTINVDAEIANTTEPKI